MCNRAKILEKIIKELDKNDGRFPGVYGSIDISYINKIMEFICILTVICTGLFIGFLQQLTYIPYYGLKMWIYMMDKLGRRRIIMDRDNKEGYLERYYILFKDRDTNLPYNVFIHKFLKSDTDMHDHPWGYCTVILSGGYWEHEFEPVSSVNTVKYWRGVGYIGYYDAYHSHKVELDNNKTCWTLFIPYKREREWGFWKIIEAGPRRSTRLNKGKEEDINREKSKWWVKHTEFNKND